MFRFNALTLFTILSICASSLELVQSTTLLLSDERVAAFTEWVAFHGKQYDSDVVRNERLMTWAKNDGMFIESQSTYVT
jgi:hypothetical protein